MTSDKMDQGISRRYFLKSAAVTAVAATATGAGAALLANSNQVQPVVTSLPTAAPPPPAAPAVVTAGNTASDALARLAASQAENIRLQAALDAAQRQLAALQEANSTSQSSAQAATEALSLELGAANQQISVLSGLVALYEQLENVDIGATLDDGLAAVSTTIANLLEQAPTLAEGVELGKQALADFEAHIPLLENGRAWLVAHLNKIQSYYNTVQALLEVAVEAVAPFLELLNQWFQNILKWLPFGMGQRTAEVMQALTDLLGETPYTISGLDTNIAQPLAVWLSNEEDETPLHKGFIKPLRAQVLEKAGEVVTQAQQVQTVYQTALAEPVQTATSHQRAIRDQIVAYRQAHQI